MFARSENLSSLPSLLNNIPTGKNSNLPSLLALQTNKSKKVEIFPSHDIKLKSYSAAQFMTVPSLKENKESINAVKVCQFLDCVSHKVKAVLKEFRDHKNELSPYFKWKKEFLVLYHELVGMIPLKFVRAEEQELILSVLENSMNGNKLEQKKVENGWFLNFTWSHCRNEVSGTRRNI